MYVSIYQWYCIIYQHSQSGAPEYIILACTGDESRLYDCFHSPIWTGLCRGAIQLTCTDVISSTSVMSSTIRPAATTSSQPFSSPSPTVTVTPGTVHVLPAELLHYYMKYMNV